MRVSCIKNLLVNRHKWNEYRDVVTVLLVLERFSPFSLSIFFEHRNAGNESEQTIDEKNRQARYEFRPVSEGSSSGSVEPRPKQDLAKVIWMPGNAP